MEIRTPQPPQAPDVNRLTSERLKAFQDALEILYIKDNLGGRIYFVEEWPEAGMHIFGPDLIQSDREGTKDRTARRALEEMAEDRRIELLDTVSGLEAHSTKGGVLQTEFVQNIIEKLGRGLALYLYAPAIVNRFIPPPPEEIIVPQAAPQEPQKIPEPEIPPVVITISDSAPVDSIPDDDFMDSIQPIDVGMPPPVSAPEAPQEPSSPAIKIFGIKEEETPPDGENPGGV